MKKTNYFSIIALVLIAGGFIVGFITKNVTTLVIINLICCFGAFGLSIAGLIFASKNNTSKVLSIVLIVIGILGTLLYGLLLGGLELIKDPKNTKDICKDIKKQDIIECKETDGEITTCRAKGVDGFEIKCYTSDMN